MSSTTLKIGLIGLGNMGRPIGQHWVAAGYDVVGFDVSNTAQLSFKQQGGTTVATAIEAVQNADIVVLILPDSKIVDNLLRDLLEAEAFQAGSTVIDMSSSEPHRTQQNALLLTQHGLKMIDAPVSGGVRGAEAGTLTTMVGGDQATVTAHSSLLEHLGQVIHVGPVGSGHAVKALNNLLSATHLWATSEAVLLGEKFGIDPAILLKVINNSSGRSGSSETKWPKFILPESFDSGFSAKLMLKDAHIATSLASSLGCPSPLGEKVVEEWAQAVADMPADADHTEIVRWLRREVPQPL